MLLHECQQLRTDAFIELRVWQVPRSVFGSAHDYKYALAYVVLEVYVLRYDNESRKGDYKHIGSIETPYRVTTPDQLLTDFGHDVDQWRPA